MRVRSATLFPQTLGIAPLLLNTISRQIRQNGGRLIQLLCDSDHPLSFGLECLPVKFWCARTHTHTHTHTQEMVWGFLVCRLIEAHTQQSICPVLSRVVHSVPWLIQLSSNFNWTDGFWGLLGHGISRHPDRTPGEQEERIALKWFVCGGHRAIHHQCHTEYMSFHSINNVSLTRWKL